MAQALASETAEVADRAYRSSRMVVYLLADQDDQMRLEVAGAAVRNGLPEIAAVLLADRADQSAYFDLLTALPDHPGVQDMADPMAVMWSGATLRLGQMVPYANPPDDAAIARSRRNAFDTMRSLWLGTPSDFISIFLNQSGRDPETAHVSKLVLTQVESGQLHPFTDPDLVWLLEYRALAKILGRDSVHDTLTSFKFSSPKIRHFSGTALQSLDTILARETLGDFVRGKDLIVPARPNLLADEFAWDTWLRVAQAVVAGDLGGVGFFDAS